ncbi:TOMM precursor leader peptide-binding protein [Dactylosporangium sp. CA-092794]|uniref:TOMM precursor leader peptide-binding protein n=1 Tax=Dactylosporangium sp. CA-092794 TaxID=3239929 RepID=UPI003D903592
MRRPRFRSDYLPVRLAGPDGAGGSLVVVGETRNLLIEDPVAAELAELLDGSRTLAEVTTQLAARYPIAALGSALRRLQRLDLLAAAPTTVEPPAAAGWDARGVEPDLAERWLRGGRVILVDAGSPTVAALAAHLSTCGLSVTVGTPGDLPAGEPDTPLLVAPGSLIDPRLARLNAAMLAEGRSWLLVRPHGHVVLVGPHLVPGETGCWECLRQRWQDNEEVPNFLAHRRPGQARVDPVRAALAPFAGTVAGLLAAELPVIAAHGRSPRLTGRMFALDTRDLSASTHRLVRRPQCPACGDPDRLAPVFPLELRSAPAEPASRTYERLEHHVSRYLGAVTRLTPLAGNDDGVSYAFSAGHNFAVARGPGVLRGNLRGLSGGKGRTEIQAKVSAIGEALERYCGVWRGDRPTRRATFAELGAGRAVHVEELLRFSDRQYAERDRRNPGLGRFHRIPRRLHPDEELEWSTAWSLTAGEPRELPAAYCWYGHPDGARLDVCGSDSNGCAAGGSTAEAVRQGFCELVERDSVALWWYHRARRPGVDLDSFGDPWFALVRRYHRDRLRRDLWVLDITADLGVPAFAAVSARLDAGDGPEEILVGFGAHLDPAAAVGRAITEVNQFLPMLGSPGGGYGVTEPDTVHWLTTARLAGQPWLRPAPDLPETTVATHPSRGTGDAAADVAVCVERAAAAGLEVIVLDQSRPDVELAVVRVVVPGLRHFWRRLGPGRLWQVPARLGWTPVAADEESANPFSVFF